MANTYTNKIILDGFRNAIVKIDGVLDTSDAVLTPAITLGDFTNNDTANLRFVGFRIDHIWHSIGNGIELALYWHGLNPERIMAIAGRGKESFNFDGGLQPNQANPGFNGAIDLLTTGFGVQGPPPQNFTVTLSMIKLYKV